MRRGLKKIAIGFIIITIVLVSYIAIENAIVIVDSVTIKHKDLPSEFEGYKILQISDLHGKTFGKNQSRLINKINKLDYDLVLFTGDYVDKDKQNLKPLEDLLKGINDNTDKYFILGNVDEDSQVYSLVKGNKYFDLFTKYNVKSLDNIGVQIKKGNESIWLTPQEYYIYENGKDTIANTFKDREKYADNLEVLKLEEQLEYEKYSFSESYSNANNPFTINISHRSIEIDYFQEHYKSIEKLQSENLDSGWDMRNKIIDWDVSISGHTHGGQFRIPFIGAVASPNSGLFPGERNIKGVHYYGGRVQYINSGLGASGPKLFRFRVFNPPSIGLIELKVK